jgi:hypothetical protein
MQVCGVQIGCTEAKHQVLARLGLPYMDIFTTDLSRTNIHVIPWGKAGEMVPGGWMFVPNYKYLADYRAQHPHYDRGVWGGGGTGLGLA